MTAAIDRANERKSQMPQTTILVGAATAAALFAGLQSYEGLRLTGYRDLAGIPTACYGDTHNIVVGRRYSVEDCLRRADAHFAKTAASVLRRTPALRSHPGALWAVTDFSYNVGTTAYATSSIARHFDRGEWHKGCESFMLYVYVGKKDCRVPKNRCSGIVKRRTEERQKCLTGL